jgi:predicted nuclease of predicted toxin-antitoxin system
MKILVDLNLPPEWAPVLASLGWQALHWSSVGNPRASDREIMDWARENGYAVFTHDLDFGAILAATQARGASVIQVRAQDVMPSRLSKLVTDALTRYKSDIESGVVISIDEVSSRVRLLPIGRPE